METITLISLFEEYSFLHAAPYIDHFDIDLDINLIIFYWQHAHLPFSFILFSFKIKHANLLFFTLLKPSNFPFHAHLFFVFRSIKIPQFRNFHLNINPSPDRRVEGGGGDPNPLYKINLTHKECFRGLSNFLSFPKKIRLFSSNYQVSKHTAPLLTLY